MNTYRVKVRWPIEEVFEIDAVDEDEAAADCFDGTVVGGTAYNDPEVVSVELIDRETS